MASSRVPRLLPLLAGAAVAVAGCATTAPVEVTRFHLTGPIAPGSFVIEQGGPAVAARPLGVDAPGTLEARGYDAIVSGELTRLGFTPAPSIQRADLVASVIVDRGTREDLAARSSGLSFGLGGFGLGGGGYHGGTAIGGGAGVTVPVGGNRSHYIVGTRLMVQIKRRSEGTVIWEGRAMTESRASDPASQPNTAVAKLAHALFTGFPGESGRTIKVK